MLLDFHELKAACRCSGKHECESDRHANGKLLVANSPIAISEERESKQNTADHSDAAAAVHFSNFSK